MRAFFEAKYGTFVTNQFLTSENQVLKLDNYVDDHNQQKEVQLTLKNLKNGKGDRLVPDSFFKENIEWGFDFSGWIGKAENKEYFFIGAEPHLNRNFQLVYRFGNFKNKTLTESAKEHLEDKNDIWFYIPEFFTNDKSEESKIDFLKKCYITDLCHVVPKGCGQVNSICEKLGIKDIEWENFRISMASEFLLKEIELIDPKIIVLHGNAARKYFRSSLNQKKYKIENSKFSIMTGELNGRKLLSIPHLKGSNRSGLWKSKNGQRTESAKKIINEFLNQ